MKRRALVLGLALAAGGCGNGAPPGDQPMVIAAGGGAGMFDHLPPHFPPPPIPADNSMTAAKVELGRHLFYDTGLSGNREQSCASCHQQANAFTDGRKTSIGSTGERHPRNAPSLANAAYYLTQNWADPNLRTLEQQHIGPIVGTAPVELGINDGNRETVLNRFRSDPAYQRMFAEAYPGEPVSLDTIVKAIASFSRTLLSYRSPFDQHLAGDAAALSEAAKRGRALFDSPRLACSDCHGGFNFSDNTRVSGNEIPQFHNTGLYNILHSAGGAGNNYPPRNQGLFEHTGLVSDKGHMKAPTLRNIAVTAPYNHDGSVATLGDVIDNYARGGRLVTEPADHAGDGSTNLYRDGKIRGFALGPEEKADLIEFLHSLTDTAFLTDPNLSDPHAL